MENLSTVLKKRRKELGLTLAQIADQMGVAEATVQRWESGNIKSIRYDKIDKLSEILKVNPASFMGWSGDVEATHSSLRSRSKKERLPTLSDKEQLDQELIVRLCQLTPEELGKVGAFVQGLLAAR